MSMSIQRSKYTGDPGLGSFLKGVVKTGLGVAGMLPGVGGIATAVGGLLFPPAPGTTTYAQTPPMTRMPPIPIAGPGGAFSQATLAGTRVHVGHGHTQASSGHSWMTPAMQSAAGIVSNGGTRCGPGQFPVLGRCLDLPGTGEVGFGLFPPNGIDMNGIDMNGMMAGRPAVSGYHWNKSGYFLMSGEYVKPGSKMVKNRRRNPANPRATSNAITRIKGAKRYAKSLSSISIRKKC